MMIPFAATMIPLFQMFANFGMINSTVAVILPAIATPFLVLLFRQAVPVASRTRSSRRPGSTG